jgi:Poly A polymerase head domain
MLEHYNAMLNTIRSLCPTAHIGGGAVRDTLLQRPIRDIDLFLDEAATDEAAKVMRSKFGFVKVGEWKSYEMFSDPAVKRVAKFEKADETVPVCLIGLWLEGFQCFHGVFDMQTNLSRFDFGICMAGWDGSEVYTAPEYKTDIEQKTFTLCRADDWPQFHYSMARFDKMTAERYAGWKLVVPAKFEAMAKEHALKKTHYFDHDTDAWMPREAVGPQLLTPKAR